MNWRRTLSIMRKGWWHIKHRPGPLALRNHIGRRLGDAVRLLAAVPKAELIASGQQLHAIMVVAGIPIPRDDHAQALADFALDSYRKETGIDLRMRIGINSGPVVAGAIVAGG